MSLPFDPRQALLTRQAALLHQLQLHEGGATRVQHARDLMARQHDDGHASDAEREVDVALSEQDRAQLAALDAALQRLAAGTYGRCEQCGEPIAAARLQARPEALHCLACAQQRESHAPAHPTL
jgi:DnaK suppressor protein